MPKTPLEQLLAALADFQERGDGQERAAAVPHLKRLYRKLEIESMPLLEQRLRLGAAEGSRDMDTIRALNDFSLFSEIVSWAEEILHPKPRTSGYPRVSL